jgi:hypothetical protein
MKKIILILAIAASNIVPGLLSSRLSSKQETAAVTSRPCPEPVTLAIAMPFPRRQPSAALAIAMPFPRRQPSAALAIAMPFPRRQPSAALAIAMPFPRRQPAALISTSCVG